MGRFHHVTQNGAQFETYESFISGILHLIFSGGKSGYRIHGCGGSTVHGKNRNYSPRLLEAGGLIGTL
jgi:hypothetical protein